MSWYSGARWGGDAEGWSAQVVAASGATWDPANKSAGIALSSGNLVASTTVEWNWETVLGTTAYGGSGAKSWTLAITDGTEGWAGFAALLPGAGVDLDSAGAATDAVILSTNSTSIDIRVNGTATSVRPYFEGGWAAAIVVGDSVEFEMNGNNFRARLLQGGTTPTSWTPAVDVTTYGVTATTLKPAVTLLDPASGTPCIRTANFSNWG